MPAGTPLACLEYREARSAIIRETIDAGKLTYDHLPRAAQIARKAGRGQRAEWERAEQSERAGRIVHATLLPGARRADGRDADRAREYQRARRSRRK
jgi:hypothetical protein